MYNSELIYKAFALIGALGNFHDDSYSDIMMMYDEKLMGYSISFVGEIDDLLAEGCSYDEIKELILACDFVKDNPELTMAEGEFLRREALKILAIRYRIYLENKNIKKKIK